MASHDDPHKKADPPHPAKADEPHPGAKDEHPAPAPVPAPAPPPEKAPDLHASLQELKAEVATAIPSLTSKQQGELDRVLAEFAAKAEAAFAAARAPVEPTTQPAAPVPPNMAGNDPPPGRPVNGVPEVAPPAPPEAATEGRPVPGAPVAPVAPAPAPAPPEAKPKA